NIRCRGPDYKRDRLFFDAETWRGKESHRLDAQEHKSGGLRSWDAFLVVRAPRERRVRPKGRLTGSANEQPEVDRHGHREVTGAIGVQLVARTANRAVGDELSPQATGLRIESRLVEVRHAVEQA